MLASTGVLTCRADVREVARLAWLGLAAAALGACGPAGVPHAGAIGGQGLTCSGDGRRDCTSPGTVRWSVDLGRSAVWAEAASADRVFFLFDGGVQAVDRRRGTPAWRADLTPFGPATTVHYDGPSASLVAGDGVLAVGMLFEVGHDSSQGWLWLLDAGSGRLLKRIVSAPGESAAVLGVSGGAAVLDHGSVVDAVDVHNGARLWQTAVASQHSWVFDAVLYQRCSSGPQCATIRRTDVRSGRPLPDLPQPADLGYVPLIAPVATGLLLVQSDRRLRVVDTATGRERWGLAWPSTALGRRFSLDRLASPPAVYLSTSPNAVEALDAETGKVLWNQPAPWMAVGAPVAHGAIVTDTRANLVGGDVRTGAARWTKPVPLQPPTTWADDEPPLAVVTSCNQTAAAGSASPCPTVWAVAINW